MTDKELLQLVAELKLNIRHGDFSVSVYDVHRVEEVLFVRDKLEGGVA